MPIGCTIHMRVQHTRVPLYIHSVGFCIAYLTTRVFSGPQTTDKQKGNPRFCYITHARYEQIIVSCHPDV